MSGAWRKEKAGKPVICILMDRPVYGVQFILESKVMAAGLCWDMTTPRVRGYIKISNKYKNGRDSDEYVLPYFHSMASIANQISTLDAPHKT